MIKKKLDENFNLETILFKCRDILRQARNSGSFFDDPTFTDGTYNLPIEARWSTIINVPASDLNVALDTALRSLAESNEILKGCFIENTFMTRNLAPNDIKKVVDEVNKISHL